VCVYIHTHTHTCIECTVHEQQSGLHCFGGYESLIWAKKICQILWPMKYTCSDILLKCWW
jgi:hypothetical protein